MHHGGGGANFQQQQPAPQQYAVPPPLPHGPPKVVAQLQKRLAQLTREKGEADGMAQILHARLAEAEEEIFELRADAVATRAEAEFAGREQAETLRQQLAGAESRLGFLTDQLRTAERVKLRAVRELDEFKERQLVETKRLEAERRRLASARRNQESVLLAASQRLQSQASQLSLSQAAAAAAAASPTRAAVTATSPATIPTESPKDAPPGYAQENAELLTKLLNTSARDLLTLFNGGASAAPPTPTNGSAAVAAALRDAGGGDSQAAAAFSQSVFSQLAGQAHAQAQASRLTFAIETSQSQVALASERARELYDTLARMLRGAASVLALAPAFVKYLAAPRDLDAAVLSSVMRVMYIVMHHSERFQRFLLVSGSSSSSSSSSSASDASTANGGAEPVASSAALLEHPRVSLPGLKFASLDEYLAATAEPELADDEPASAESATELKQQRARLLSALCRVVRNNAHQPAVVEDGLCVLSFWVDLGAAAPATQPDFKPLLSGHVIQDILLAPKSPPRVKRQALSLLAQLLQFPDMFPEVAASAKKSLLFNRCAQMLVTGAPRGAGGTGGSAISACDATNDVAAARDMRALQLQVVHVLLAIVTCFPSTGVRFVLDATRGLADDADGHRSAVFYLAQLLHHETFPLRVAACVHSARASSDDDGLRDQLVRDAFTLLSLLVRYVDLSTELDGAEHEHAFLSVLRLLGAGHFDADGNDSVSKTAAALAALFSSSSS
ncbi:hypothetical protein PybrP1_001558 [[Pythium] brassicae (nom. inval.)]|nr:hypothetical protein PybrP1_001558 [[Pythium] brassicae (nom. inval.)]